MTQQPHDPNQPYPYMQQPPAPKKKVWYTRWWAIALGVVLVLIIIGSVSGGGEDATTPTADSQPEATVTETATPDATPTKPSKKKAADKPAEVDDPGPLTVGNWEVIGKLKPTNDGLGDYTATFRVKNTSDAPDTGIFTVNVLKGDDIWTSMDCAGPEVAPGQVGTVDCFSTDKFRKGWSDVTIENSF